MQYSKSTITSGNRLKVVATSIRRAIRYVRTHCLARKPLYSIVVPLLVLVASLAVSWSELRRQDRIHAIEREALRSRDAIRGAALFLMPAEQYFEPELRSSTFDLIGEATATCPTIHMCRRKSGESPSMLAVRFPQNSEAVVGRVTGMADVFVETTIAEGDTIREGDRLWVYRVELPTIERLTGEAIGPVHERFIGTLRPLRDRMQLTRRVYHEGRWPARLE